MLWQSLKKLNIIFKKQSWNSLVVQWLGFCALTAEGLGSLPGQGPKIPKAIRCRSSLRLPKKSKFSKVIHTNFFFIISNSVPDYVLW